MVWICLFEKLVRCSFFFLHIALFISCFYNSVQIVWQQKKQSCSTMKLDGVNPSRWRHVTSPHKGSFNGNSLFSHQNKPLLYIFDYATKRVAHYWLHVVLSKWSTFQNRWQKVPPMVDPVWTISLRRCSHPWERSSRCGRSSSQARVVLTQVFLLPIVKIQHIHNGLGLNPCLASVSQ